MLGDEILIDIDTTLDRLIQNAEAIQKVDIKKLLQHELDAFQKTQDSLIHHLLHMDELLENKRTCPPYDQRAARFKIAEKRCRFALLKQSYAPRIQKAKTQDSIFCKRRSKKLLRG